MATTPAAPRMRPAVRHKLPCSESMVITVTGAHGKALISLTQVALLFLLFAIPQNNDTWYEAVDEMCVCDIQHNIAIIPQTENTIIGWYELAIKKL